MECIMKCGMPGNQTCMNNCMNTYDDDVFDAFMKCMAQDHHCLTLTPPDPSFRCNPPQSALKKFSLSQFQGKWYIVLGLNPEYDCYPCQISSYAPTPGSNNYTLTEHYDVSMLNGSIRHRGDQQQVAQFDVFTEGKLDYTSSLMGLTMFAQWLVMDYDEDGNYALMYYCGHMASNWWYEGSIVYSRQPVLSAADTQAIGDVIHEKLGRDISDYCKPRTTGCIS